ncbi:hypothetical protein [Pseudobutyrivibrio sp.]
MLKVEYDLGELSGEFCVLCNPTLIVSEDTSVEKYVVSIGVGIAVGEARELAEMFKEEIPKQFNTVKEFRNAMQYTKL